MKRYSHFINPVADTLSYCLMPIHLHLLIQIKPEEDLEETFGKFETFQKLNHRLSKQFANLFSSYNQAFNKTYKRKGSLFRPNFKRKEIHSENYLTKIIHYIHANPVRHGFVTDINYWRWSSHRAYISHKPTLLKRDKVWKWFGGKAQYEIFHNQGLILQKDEIEY